MVDPGTVSTDLLKANGYPTTKSKMCTNSAQKIGLFAAQALGEP